ncbi:Cytochrome P450, partial [Dillenia turbinata]
RSLSLFIYLRCLVCDSRKKLPPGPQALPIIGNLHMLGSHPHQKLCSLSKKYGPIMSIRLGKELAIVVSSPEAAKRFLKTHETTFLGRPKNQAADRLSYGRKAMSFSDYGPYWRSLRKLYMVELLSSAKINSFAGIRRKEVGLAVNSVREAALAGQVVDVSAVVAALIENITYIMIFGESARDENYKLKHVIEEAMMVVSSFDLSDYVPNLQAFDLQGIKARTESAFLLMDKILEAINRGPKDVVDMLLLHMNYSTNSVEEPRLTVKAIIFELLTGAIHTSTTAIEWVISELLQHPRVMKKLQQEIQSIIGLDRMIEEADLAKFKYLDMVLKESLRLHPVGELLIPRQSMEDARIEDYHIPKNSIILVNAWAVGRDPDVWSEKVNDFYPERFQDNNIEISDQNFQLIPFGSGRRSCPGMQLGLRNVKLVVAQLVHCFDWELPDNMLAGDLDMSEKHGLTTRRAKNLLARPTNRLHFRNI